MKRKRNCILCDGGFYIKNQLYFVFNRGIRTNSWRTWQTCSKWKYIRADLRSAGQYRATRICKSRYLYGCIAGFYINIFMYIFVFQTFWYHNEKMINYDAFRGVAVNSDSEKSILTIQDATKDWAGNFSCVPSNAKATSISVHILNGKTSWNWHFWTK